MQSRQNSNHPEPPRRFRDFGFDPGILKPGNRNTIADVSGVRVGHCTRIEGDSIRTGVTLIDPGIADLFHQKLPAAIAIGNGFGKLTGITQVNELGTLETPIVLTNTLSVGTAMQGLIKLVLRITPQIAPNATINAIVGETNDSLLNDVHRFAITEEDVAAAYAARTRDFALGSVGAGTGTCAFSWKGGIGSASRIVKIAKKRYTLGTLLQTNFGGALTIMGIPVGRILGKTNFDRFAPQRGDGSCMIVLATDAPLCSRQLHRIAKRAILGLAKTGSILAHGSGDYAIAFSTNRSGVAGANTGSCLADADLNPLFLAAVEAVEESVYDSMFTAQTMSGRNGAELEQLPVQKVVKIMRNAYGGVARSR